ncbi:PilN domain-containing protein [Candidatus Albibeggiatoa sp. nov. NOAA]|uniref:PilN domain-containing protein n=1 Tax=Candidatus Albibeggiatoa sp. nov. NOAA TaxID=3162724 RepID=UPI003304139C|nr:PilN domain-containing protein [Thiotrichaceae bacterium]
MPNVNLLPWREKLKKEREARFGVAVVAGLAVAGLIMLGVHLYMQSLISYQQSRNSYLDGEIKLMEQKIKEIEQLEDKKQRLIERMNVIQELETSRPRIVHLFDELVLQAPDGVYFTSMEQKGEQVTLEGYAQSDARVSSLMKAIERSEWMKNPTIIEIVREARKNSGSRNKQKQTVSTFKLRFNQAAPKATEEEEA